MTISPKKEINSTSEIQKTTPSGVSCFVLPSFLGLSDIGQPLAFISPGGGELLLILLVLILLFGAKDAPRIFRAIQSALDKAQRAAASFRYKILYDDLHSNPSDEKPYDVEADYPEENEEAQDPQSDGRDPLEKETSGS